MEVKFTSTTKQNLNSLPIVNGQLIAVSDMDEYYYDLGSERRSVSGVVVRSSLPATGQTNKLYIVSDNNEIRLYTYDGQQFCTTGSGNIDDLGPSTTTTYSSSKIESLVDTKQDDLMGSTYVGNIDTLYGQNKIYWINISNLPSGNTGALPFDSGYFHLICLSVGANTSSQIAIPFYNTTGATVSSGQLYYRQYTNNKWYSWRRVYDSTETTSAITSAIAALDVSSVGGSGKYISAISETDGKISATATSLATSPASGNTAPITSGGVWSVLANIQSLFTVAETSKDNVSIAGGATADSSVTGVTPIAKTNYKPIALVGVDLDNASSSGTGVVMSSIIAFGLTSTIAYAQIKNTASSTIKIKIRYRILYARSTS